MFRFLTTADHAYTVDGLVKRQMPFEIPRCDRTTYAAMFEATHTRRAVHVFTDLERLSDPELARAASLYRTLRAAGIPCMNDPARVMTRYELLCSLFEAGINSFAAYRADGQPRPSRFPVFVRRDGDHNGPMSELIEDQDALDGLLLRTRDSGRPLRGLLVIGYAGGEESPGLYRKVGTYTIGGRHSVAHVMFSDHWMIKQFNLDLATVELQEREKAEVIANRLPEAIRQAFEIAGIDWGRADHSISAGRDVVYEINTNPVLMVPNRGGLAIRAETKLVAQERMAKLLWESDQGDGMPVRFQAKLPVWRRGLGRVKRVVKARVAGS